METSYAAGLRSSTLEEDADGIPTESIQVVIVAPLGVEEPAEAFLADLAVSLWLLRRDSKVLPECA